MIRDEEFRTPKGQAAWQYYQEWMRAYRKRVPRPQSFLQSKFYNAFMRFASFAMQVNMPDPTTFIHFMKDKDIIPALWTNDQVYGMYIEFLDRRGDPTKQADITINTLFNLADDLNCEPCDVFDNIDTHEFIQLLRQRQLSPWILLNSKRFLTFFTTRISDQDRIIIETIIRPDYWSAKFQQRPKDQKLMKLFISELNL